MRHDCRDHLTNLCRNLVPLVDVPRSSPPEVRCPNYSAGISAFLYTPEITTRRIISTERPCQKPLPY